MQRRACIASRMLSSSVVSPRQTVHGPAREPRVTAKTNPSPSISGTAHAFIYTCASQCAEGLHFSAFHSFFSADVRNTMPVKFGAQLYLSVLPRRETCVQKVPTNPQSYDTFMFF